MKDSIKVKRRAFSVVPDDILADARLSWRARVLLAWMLGRSENFDLRIHHIRKVFRISEQQWAPSVSLVVRLAISPKSNPEGAAWSPCATLFRRA